MPWTRLDDGFHRHPKILALSDAAHRMFVDTLNWSVANLTDGHIPTHLPNVSLPHGTPRARKAAVADLVACGLWSENGAGWVIHDFADYQETKEEVRARREKWSEKKRSHRDSPRDTPRDGPGESPSDPARTGVPIPIPKVEAKASTPIVVRDDPERINRNGIWTALEDLFGEATTKSARTLRGKLVKSLDGAGASYTSVKERSAVWSKLFPGRNGQPAPTLTDTALEKWWGPLGLIVETGKPPPPCDVCGSRRIVGVTSEGEIVRADDGRAVTSERCGCVRLSNE